MQNSAAIVYSIELFFIGGDLGVHNQCTMADGENVYYRGEGICNLVLATEKVIILFFNEWLIRFRSKKYFTSLYLVKGNEFCLK